MTVYRKDYKAPHYGIDQVTLDFNLGADDTIVKSTIQMHRNGNDPILLNGQELELKSISINGKPYFDYELVKDGLLLKNTPEQFTLETEVVIHPIKNTGLSGLYYSSGVLCTQCEAEGFRRITYYPDHPDVMAKFTVIMHGDRKKYPVLLSNGNCVTDDGVTAVFEDPFKKPSYLFALIAGDLGHISDTFITASGNKVGLHIYAEHGKENSLLYAMDALKRSMKWDEEAFGREYDLDIFNIVALRDFNMGAMENKSLNVFNDQCLLADEKTATDGNYANIETVIAHEYFHNWSGDRVTAREWFDLSLKEGFTVFRDQSFSADQRSAVVGRIDDVEVLKNAQFPEDDGPLAHPVRPECFETIDNFYTATIYDKGAELIRMQQTILGKIGFRRGCDLYFNRHDGQAVTIDDFVKCMEDANAADLSQFMHWYSVAGRPTVDVKSSYDADKKQYILTLFQKVKGFDKPFLIPFKMGLIDWKGKEVHAETILLKKMEQTFVFDNIENPVVLSINRHFTAPVTLNVSYTDEERLHLISHDTDLYNRYEVGQEYAVNQIIQNLNTNKVPEKLIEAFGTYLDLDDNAFVARAIGFPSSSYIGDRMDVFDVDGVLETRRAFVVAFAKRFKDKLLNIYNKLDIETPFSAAPAEANRRALKNMVLSYLARLPETEHLVLEAYQKANNLTDEMAALSTMVNVPLAGAAISLAQFGEKGKTDHLLFNKWLGLTASLQTDDVLEITKQTMNNPLFNFKNPNNLRSLIGVFTRNLKAFHKIDGSGYEFLSDIVIELDKLNPQMAERILHPLTGWRKFDLSRKELMKKALIKISTKPDISVNLSETVSRATKE